MLNNQKTKICIKCQVDKEFKDFYIIKSTQKHENTCKKCRKDLQSEYRIKNIKKIREYQKAYREIHTVDRLEYQRSYQKANLKKAADRQRSYYKTPIGKAFNKNKHYNRRIQKGKGDVTTKQILELQQSNTNCYWCNCNLHGKKVHIDHYIPLSKGGEHTISNLVISCPKCNLSKGAKDPIEFANLVGKLS